MYWRDLVLGSRIYEDHEPADRFYYEYQIEHQAASWISRDGPSEGEVARLVLFLNQWWTHYPSGATSQAALRQAFLEAKAMLTPMLRLSIVDADFEADILPGISLAMATTVVFSYIATCGPRTETTGTSKMLHMLNPRFFVMWDAAIRRGYKVRRATGEEYASNFLPLMQRELQEAITSFAEDNQATPNRPDIQLEALRAPRTLAKMIDEYNYMKYTKMHPQLR
jgi:hypothetical protein